MADVDAYRERARATWAAGDWDGISRVLVPIGELALDRSSLEDGMDVLDVGTGSGGTIAIPAAQRGAKVVGVDITPELLEHGRRRAGEAGVEVQWVEADAQDLPFADASFDRVYSTFGAMFAPDHRRAASELVRVCRPGGRVVMTTWSQGGFSGGLFELTGSFMPSPAAGVETPVLWADPEHVTEMFEAAGAHAAIARQTVVLTFASRADAVHHYTEYFGPIVMLRANLEPAGRWPEFVEAFARLVERCDSGDGGEAEAQLEAEYLLITVRR